MNECRGCSDFGKKSFLMALLNCFLSSLVELNYQSTSSVFKTGNVLLVLDMSESRGVAGL